MVDVTLNGAAVAAPAARRVFLGKTADTRFNAVRRAARSVSGDVTFFPAYSIKTNPAQRMVERANAFGLFAEVISDAERRWAEECGFSADAIVYNGPVPIGSGKVRAAFADSTVALRRYLAKRPSPIACVRLRPSMVPSRFGCTADDDAELIDLLREDAAGTGLAVSFHVRREDYGRAGWRDIALHVARRGAALASASGRTLEIVDVGGGWTPREFDARFADDARWLARTLRALAPSCSRVIFEPGQAIATPCEALLATVVEVRSAGSKREAIVNAGYPDWPQMHTFAHRLFMRGEHGRWQLLRPGGDSLGGRTCLEYDRIEGIALPERVEPGDEVLIGDCGAYDQSMSFRFATGSN